MKITIIIFYHKTYTVSFHINDIMFNFKYYSEAEARASASYIVYILYNV